MMFSPNFGIVLLSILFVDTACNGVSEAFVTFQYNLARITPCRSLKFSELSFHPQIVEHSEFHTPAESFTFTRYAKTTISSEYVQSEWKENDNSRQLSYLDVISSTVSVSNSFDQNQDIIDSGSPEEPLIQARRIQQAYREWCEFYEKIPNEERLGIFASNYLAVEVFHKKTGRPLALNEFADLTEEEYQYRQGNQSPTIDCDEKSVTTEKALAEDRIREAYRQWCEYYERSYDEMRLQNFAASFVAVEEYHLRTNEPLVLNEFADMTEPEYRNHLATAANSAKPEKIEPRANNDSNSFLQEQKEAKELNTEPITSYLDTDPNPISHSQAEELRLSTPISHTQTVQSNDKNSNPVVSSDTMHPSDTSSSTNEVLATLQSRFESLSTMVQSLATAPPPAAPPAAQPLDSLVIDLLQQQDSSISQLEESVEGLHEIQKQSSDLIELVSNNQKQMTEMMEAVQSEVFALQQDQKEVEENYTLLLSRIEELEAVAAKFDSSDPVLDESLVLLPATAISPRGVELKHSILPVGMVQPCVFP